MNMTTSDLLKMSQEHECTFIKGQTQRQKIIEQLVQAQEAKSRISELEEEERFKKNMKNFGEKEVKDERERMRKFRECQEGREELFHQAEKSRHTKFLAARKQERSDLSRSI